LGGGSAVGHAWLAWECVIFQWDDGSIDASITTVVAESDPSMLPGVSLTIWLCRLLGAFAGIHHTTFEVFQAMVLALIM
jgi:hypothetical protein